MKRSRSAKEAIGGQIHRLSVAKFPWILTAGVLVTLGLTVIPPFRRAHLEYDAMATLTALAVIGLIWAAYFAWQTLQYQRRHDADFRARRRRTTAQAMLVDLNRIRTAVSGIKHPDAPLYVPGDLAHPVLDRGLDAAEEFQLITVYRLADLIDELAMLVTNASEYLAAKGRAGAYPSSAGGVKLPPPFAPQLAHAQSRADSAMAAADRLETELHELSRPLLVVPNDTYTVSFAGVKPGKYDFNCRMSCKRTQTAARTPSTRSARSGCRRRWLPDMEASATVHPRRSERVTIGPGSGDQASWA